MNDIIIATAFFISLSLGLIFIPLLVILCLRMNWTDIPGHRKVHAQPVPRLGGLMFLPSMGISLMGVLWMLHGTSHIFSTLQWSSVCMCIGALMIYIVGLVDDLHELKATTKFAVQFVAALIFPLCNLQISNLNGFLGIYELPFWASYCLTVFVILLITNAMNLIDGIDGLCSGISILIMLCFTVLYAHITPPTFLIISAATMGALVAFFAFNMWGRVGAKKIFMGDSGSLILGYVIAYLAIKYQMLPECADAFGGRPLLVSYTLVIIPTFDVIRVACNRILNGKGMFTPDKTHIHHRVMAMGLTMHQTLVAILLFFCLCCSCNYMLYMLDVEFTWIVLIDIVLYSFVICLTNLSVGRKC